MYGIKLDVPASHLSWSHWVKGYLERKNPDEYLTGEMIVVAKGTAEYGEWRSTNSLLYTWLLNSMVASISKTIDGIEVVSDIWGKLMRIYVGIPNNMSVPDWEGDKGGSTERWVDSGVCRRPGAIVGRLRPLLSCRGLYGSKFQDYDHFFPADNATTVVR